MIFVMSISMLCVPAMAAEEASFSPPDDELICEMGRFISDLVDLFGSDFAANHYDKLKVGDAIPTYSLDQGSDSIHLFVMTRRKVRRLSVYQPPPPFSSPCLERRIR